VRVVILDAPAASIMLDKALAQLLKAAEGLAATLPQSVTPVSTDAWAEGVVEKYRRQGFTP